MTSLSDALKAAGIAVPTDSAGVIDPAAMAGVDTTNMQAANQSEVVEPAQQEDDLAPPAFLKRKTSTEPVEPPAKVDPPMPDASVPDAPVAPTVSSAFGDLAPVPVEPTVVNTVVPAPVTIGDVTPAAPTSGGDPNPGSNQPTSTASDRRAVLRTITSLGENEGLGVNARSAFFEKVADAARLGALTEDDAELVQTKYNEGVAKAKGIGVVKMQSETQQRSKIKAMIKLGALPAIRADLLLANVRDRISEARSAGEPPKKSPADIYLSVARMQLSQPQHMLTDAQIDQAMASKTPDQKIEADLLYQLATAADKLLAEDAKTPLSDESRKLIEDWLPTVVKRVDDLGGTTARQKELKKIEDRQKRDAEKAAKLANQGSGTKLRSLGAIPGGVAYHRTA